MNDSEKQKKNDKFVAFMNTGVILLIVSGGVYFFAIVFNYGYNSFFGLPAYFTTMLPLHMVSEVIIFISFVIIYLNIWPIVGTFKKNPGNFFLNPLIVVVLMVFAFIAKFILHNEALFITLMIPSLLHCILIIFILASKRLKIDVKYDTYEFNRVIREKEIRKSLHENGFVVLENCFAKNRDQDFTPKNEKESQLHFLLFSRQNNLIHVLFFVFLFVCIVFLLYSVAYFGGLYSAIKEQSFLFIDEQTVVIDIYENNYVSILVDYDEDENQYVQTGTYKLIPIDNAELRLQKKDGIKIVASE